MPCSDDAALQVTSQGHGTARHCMWAICPGSVSSGYHGEFHEWLFGLFRLQTDFHDFHEGHGTVGARQGAQHSICKLAFIGKILLPVSGIESRLLGYLARTLVALQTKISWLQTINKQIN